MKRQTLNAAKREVLGRKVKRLRKQGVLPGNIFGNDKKSVSVSVNQKEFEKVYKEAGETGLIDLVVDSGDTVPVLVNNVSFHPVLGSMVHVDFHQVNLKEKVTANVPLEFIGEAPAEKQGVGTAVSYLTELEVEALPTDLPENFIVDISNLAEVDQAIYVKDIQVDTSKVTISADPETIITKVEEQKVEVVEETPPPSEEGVVGDTTSAETQEGASDSPSEEKSE